MRVDVMVDMIIGCLIGLGFGLIFGLLIGIYRTDMKYKEKISKGKTIQIGNVYYQAEEVRREVIIWEKKEK